MKKNTQITPKTNNLGFALRQLLQDGNVGTQEEICTMLEKQGYEINQSKVSRMLHKIGAVKVINQEGQNIYRLPHEHGLMHELSIPKLKVPVSQWIINITNNKSLIVVHTTPAAGSLVAREVDLHQVDLGILGTIAGDDTVLIIPKDEKNIKKIIAAIKNLLAPN